MHPPSDAGIDVGIITLEAGRLLGFYRDLLGLEPAGDVTIPGGRIFRLRHGASLLKLFVPDQPPPEQPPAPKFLARSGLHYVTIRVGNIRPLLDACVRTGIPVLVPLVQPRPDLLAAIVADPDGNPVELMQTIITREET